MVLYSKKTLTDDNVTLRTRDPADYISPHLSYKSTCYELKSAINGIDLCSVVLFS